MRIAASLGALLLCSAASGGHAADAIVSQPLLHDVAGAVQAGELHATVTRLVGFGTRHTLSDTISGTRGIGAARRWVHGRFQEISRQCHGCLTIDMPEQTVTGDRVPTPAVVADVVAIQRGTTDPDRVIIISGHIDSRVSDPMNATADAPGADDDGSGTAAVIEAARVLSRHKFRATLVFAVLSGEEQGLYGGKIMAQYARDHHWQVEAVLNNDIVGNSTGTNGEHDSAHVRVFSEGTRSIETAEEATRRRYNGGEVDSPSRNLMRFVDTMAERYVPGLDARMVYRTDRFSRGGDQVPMLAAGYPAVRITEAIENYHHEHQDVRSENGIDYGDRPEFVDYDYLAQVTRLNAVTMAALAMAPSPPTGVKTEGAVSHDTTVTWAKAADAAAYRVYWRDTTAPQWAAENVKNAGDSATIVLKNVNVDDWFFGVSAVSKDGYESPIVFPGPAGAFVAPAPAAQAAH